MKHQSYFTRALKANDPRYARIFGKMGYDTAALVAAAPEADPLDAARELYSEVVGKRPYHGWDVETLNAKIAEHRAR